VVKMDEIQGFLKQSRGDLAPWFDTMEKMKAFLG